MRYEKICRRDLLFPAPAGDSDHDQSGVRTGAFAPFRRVPERELEFRCIRRLAEETPADALVTFMDLSVEAEAFGSEIRWSEYENPTVSGSIASTLDEIEKLKIPEAGSGRTGEVLRCVELCAAGCDRPVLGG